MYLHHQSLHSVERSDPQITEPQYEPFSVCKSSVLRCVRPCINPKQWHVGVCEGPERHRKTLSDAISLKLLQWCMSFRNSKTKHLLLTFCYLPTLFNLMGYSSWVSHPTTAVAYLISLLPGGFTLQVPFLTAHTSLMEALAFTFSVLL